MNINTSPEAIQTILVEKNQIIEREAKRMFNNCWFKTGVIDYDDFLQEARKAVVVTMEYFSRSASPIERFDAYLVLGIQGELKNWIAKTSRQFNCTFDEPQMLENIPEVDQNPLSCFEDIEVLEPLSEEAAMFLKCLFTPPPELAQKIKAKVTSGKPHSKSILPQILEWMKLSYDEFNAIKAELVEKCEYTPAGC